MIYLQTARAYMSIYKASGLKHYKTLALKQIKLAKKSRFKVVA